MIIITSCLSELQIEPLPSVVHVRVPERDVVHCVVADGADHLRMIKMIRVIMRVVVIRMIR